MKKLLITPFFLLFMNLAHADDAIGNFYLLKVQHALQECDLNGVPVLGTLKILPANSKFTVVNKIGTDYVIKFWKWGNANQLQQFQSAADAAALAGTPRPTLATNSATGTNPTAVEKIESYNLYYDATSATWRERYFLISDGDLSLFAKPTENSLSPAVGVVTLPFKARPITGEFTKDISINGLGGIRYKGFYGDWSTLVGVGIASVNLDSANTGGRLTKASDFAAISFTVGEVFEWKKLQIGLFVGWDKLKKTDVNGWKNQGNLWWGFGIGFSIFSQSTPEKEKAQ